MEHSVKAISWKTIPIHDYLVVHGFVHYHCDINVNDKNLTLYIPDDIINFIILWYHDVSIWKLEGHDLNRFFDLKNGEAMYSKEFYVEGIEFCCSLCPNGWKTNQTGFVQYYLELKSLPSNITNCTVYFEFYCYQTKSSWKGIRTLSKSSDAVGWFHYTLSLNQCKLFFAKCLIFGCCVKILDVNYVIDRNKKKRYHTDEEKTEHESISNIKSIINNYIGKHLMEKRPIIKLNKRTQITWMLNKYPLQKFKYSINPKNFHSPNFMNDYWCFECQANYKHNIMIYCRLKLLRMPINISSMKVDVLLDTNMKSQIHRNGDEQTEDSDESNKEYVILNYNHNYSTWKVYETEEKHENSLRISVKINIIELWDINNQMVDISEWYKHGIIRNHYEPSMIIQYADSIQNDGKNQILTHLGYEDKKMMITKRWIKPNFLNIPMFYK